MASAPPRLRVEPDLAGQAARTSSIKGNPIQLTAEELCEIALRAL